MNERLLQFIWQTRLFSLNNLKIASGEALEILHFGTFNRDAGPDFLNGRIKIGNTILAGNIELHVLASDWKRHRHSNDEAYNNVILHVVWSDDGHDTKLPTLELQPRVSNIMLDRYANLMAANGFIPCENLIANVPSIITDSWVERMAVEKLEFKARHIFEMLKNNGGDWDETFWQLLAGNFGIVVNKEAFQATAVSIPLKIISKIRFNRLQLEAVLFGQAGLLPNDSEDKYAVMLKKEYAYLARKYSLSSQPVRMKSLRMRPAAFPSIRLSQLASLLYEQERILNKILDANNLEALRKLLKIQTSEYWRDHYVFGEPSAGKRKYLGKSTIDNILINSFIPVIFAYGSFHKKEDMKDKALNLLHELAAEKNSIITNYQRIGVQAKDAGETQGLLHLYKNYCSLKRCLECAIGNALIKARD